MQHSNKLFLFLFVFLLISSVSALNIDNTKSYDALNKEAVIKNNFGFGEEIARIKLNTPLINYVPIGYTKVFEVTIDSKYLYKNAINSMETYNKKGNKLNNKIDLKYLKDGVWVNLNKDIPEGEITLGGFTNVQANDYVEWIPEWFGVKIKEWAIYATDPQLRAYYKLDEVTGNFNDSTMYGRNSTVNYTIVRGFTGILNNATNTYTGNNSSRIYIGNNFPNSNISISVWINPNVSAGRENYLYETDAGGFDFSVVFNSTGQLAYNNGTNRISTTYVPTANVWSHLVITMNNTNSTVYVNGVIVYNGAGGNTGTGTNLISLGNHYSPSFNLSYVGSFDEVAIFNKSITPADVNKLYYAGFACGFPFADNCSSQIVVTPIRPISTNVNSNPTFNWYVFSTVNTNISNSSLYVFNQSKIDLDNDPSLVAYYKLDGNANDETGRNNATRTNSTYLEGQVGGAYKSVSYPSVTSINNQNIQLPPNAQLNLSSSQNVTFSAWIYNNGDCFGRNTTHAIGLIGKGFRGYTLGVQNSASQCSVSFDLRNNSQGPTGSATGNVLTNGWNFVTGTYNGTHTSIYRNGILINSNAVSIVFSGDITTSAYLNMTIIGPPSGGSVGAFNGSIDEVMIFNRSLSANEIYVLYNQSQSRYSTSVNSNQTVQINATLSNFNEGTYNWSAYANGINTSGNYVGSFSVVQSFNVDNTLPSVRLVTPINSTYIYSINSSRASFNINVSASDASLDKVWYNSSFNSTDTFVTNNAVNILNTSNIFGLQNIYACANDTANNVFCNQSSIYIHRNYFSNTAYETESIYLSLEVWNQSITPTGVLYYNGTNYTGTVTSVGNEKYTINTTSFDIPTGVQNRSFQWFWNNGLDRSSDIYNQTVNGTYFILCNSTISDKILSLNFKDETNLTNINETIPLATFGYYLGSGTVSKNYTYTNSTVNSVYNFCISPNRTINIDPYVQYATTNYPQRIWDIAVSSYSTFTNQTLYSLSSSLGLYVTFQVINIAQQPLNGVVMNFTRTISGINTIVGTAMTGASGTATLWLNPDFQHTAYFYLSPYPLYTLTQAFTDSSYTISLGGTASSNVSDYTKGVTYSISPNLNNYFQNDTVYPINLTLSSTYWSLDSFGFNITTNNGTLLNSTSSTSSSGTLNQYVNTGGYSSICINYYWIVNSTQTYASNCWVVLDTAGNIFSISHLLGNLSTYMASGFFGITNFGVGIFIFLIVVLTTGTIKIKYGLNDETVLFGIIFALVALFDVSFGLIPNPVNAVDNFPTIFMGLVFSGFMLKEYLQ